MGVAQADLRIELPSGIFFGVDPGLDATGCCIIFGDEKRVEFLTVRSKYEGPFSLPYRVKEVVSEVRQFMYLMADFLVVEHMQVYTQRQQKGDPNDLIDLSYLSGSIAQALCWSRCGLPTPKAWKGGIDKKPHHARLRTHVKNLKGRVSGHAWDAFGLALYGAEKYAYTQKR